MKSYLCQLTPSIENEDHFRSLFMFYVVRKKMSEGGYSPYRMSISRHFCLIVECKLLVGWLMILLLNGTQHKNSTITCNRLFYCFMRSTGYSRCGVDVNQFNLKRGKIHVNNVERGFVGYSMRYRFDSDGVAGSK